MRYIIIGAGAVGGTIGGCLFQAGHDVVLVARGAHLDALKSRGLRLTTPLGPSTLGIPAAGGPAGVGLRPGDTLILTAKTQDAAALLDEWAWQPVSGGTVAAQTLPVVCAQNGVASERFALRRFRQVYGMHVWLPATHLEPGEVEAQGVPLAGLLHVGRYPSGADATSERIAEDLGKSRFLAPVSQNVMRWKYGKLLDNLNNAIEALCGRGASGFGAEAQAGDAAELRRLVRDEGTAVLDIAGFDYSNAAELAEVRRDSIRIEPVNGSARAGGSSWQSLTRQTGTIEANYLNGEIVLLGRRCDVPTPVNEALQRLANQAARERRPPGSMTPAQILAAAGVREGSGDTPPPFRINRFLSFKTHRSVDVAACLRKAFLARIGPNTGRERVSAGRSRDSGWMHETRPEQAHPTPPPGPPGATEPSNTPGAGKMWAAALAALMLVFVGLGGYDLFTNRHLLGVRPVARSAASPARSVIAHATGSPSTSATGSASASASATAQGSPSASSSPTPLRVLSAVSAVAFGPDGTSDGDNPGIASHVLAGDGVDAWQSAWYKSAAFGNLQAGTGLLVDMGRPVSISSVHLVLGAALGADVQVRLGDTPDLGDLSTAASADDVGGKVRLAPPAPVRARYVLVWFTLLPPDGSGTYQISVYGITIDGRP